MEKSRLSCLALSAALLWPGGASAQNEHFQALHKHFETIVRTKFDSLFTGGQSLSEWEARKQAIRRELTGMLWEGRIWPESTPAVKITNRVQTPGYTVECLVLETAPSLYATANLYLPAGAKPPFPVILYQCGHAPNGPYGGKNVYKHHGAWFAARGIAVLVLDNIEMGEIDATHHGLFPPGWFDWYSRGYSPLAVELFNAGRVLDYLAGRPEIDSSRIGATGISGGGILPGRD